MAGVSQASCRADDWPYRERKKVLAWWGRSYTSVPACCTNVVSASRLWYQAPSSAPPPIVDEPKSQKPRKAKRTAVLLVHGIGEQLPMETLRGFAQAVWTEDADQFGRYTTSEVWSKPDPGYDNFEMRRLVSGQNTHGVKVDFYEFYWAHLMSGTELGRVWEWLRSLLFRKPWHVPTAVLWAYLLLWLLTLASLFVLCASVWSSSLAARFPSWVVQLVRGLAVVVPAATVPLIRNFVGDAARYLHPSPKNVAIRGEIQRHGVELLEHIIASEHRYGRVIVVGHSLGSVIAYDLLTHAWAKKRRQVPEAALERIDNTMSTLVAQTESSTRTSDFDEVQGEWQSALGQDWPVTDFFSLGSPLAHADSLIEKSQERLKERLAHREMPACPPVFESRAIGRGKERKFVPTITYEHAGATWLHHATLFLPTRWTNFYFTHPLPLLGDPIGGPAAPLFGPGVRDVPLRWRLSYGLFAHTSYFRLDGSGASEHLKTLRDILRFR